MDPGASDATARAAQAFEQFLSHIRPPGPGFRWKMDFCIERMISDVENFMVPITLIFRLVRDCREAETLLIFNQELQWIVGLAKRWIRIRDDSLEFREIEGMLSAISYDEAITATIPLLRRAVSVTIYQLDLIKQEMLDSFQSLDALVHRIQQCAEINFRVALELDLVPNTGPVIAEKRAMAAFEERLASQIRSAATNWERGWAATARLSDAAERSLGNSGSATTDGGGGGGGGAEGRDPHAAPAEEAASDAGSSPVLSGDAPASAARTGKRRRCDAAGGVTAATLTGPGSRGGGVAGQNGRAAGVAGRLLRRGCVGIAPFGAAAAAAAAVGSCAPGVAKTTLGGVG